MCNQRGLAASRISPMSWNEGTASSISAPILYAIDFSSPPHLLLQSPAIDLGPIPRRGPSYVWPYGGANAVVESALGPLNSQPVVFRTGGQLVFDVQNLTVPRPDVFTFTCDMHIERITGEGLTILIDTPEVRRLNFIPGNIATVWIPFGVSYSALHPSTPIVHIAMEMDLTNHIWSISFNDTLWGRFDLLTNNLTCVRISANGLNGADIAMAFDNIQIVGGRVTADPSTALSWTNGPAMSMPHCYHTATALKDGRILIVGGNLSDNDVTTNCEIYDPVNNTYQPTGSLNVPRSSHSATLLPDGRVLVVSGLYWLYSPDLDSAEIYNPASGTWSLTAQPIFAHGLDPATTLLKDGRVLVVGGDALPFDNEGVSDRAEIFDPVGNTWSAAAYHEGIGAGGACCNALLNDGRVLFSSRNTNTYIYNPVNDTWQSGGAISMSRVYATSVVLQDGRVMVIGGAAPYDNNNSYVDIYDPAVNAWSPTAPLLQGRYGHTATILPDGRVVVAGGIKRWVDDRQNPDNYLNNSVEIYNPATGQWEEGPALNFKRAFHTSTLLRDGRLFVAGGRNGSVWLNTTEVLIDPSLVLYFPFSGDAKDQSGRGNDGAVYGATLTSNGFGASDRAYQFDGSDDYIDCGQPTDLNFTGPFTISAWINPLEIEGYGSKYRTIVGKWKDWNPGDVDLRQYTLGFGHGGYVHLGIGAGGPWDAVISAEPLTTGVWTHIAGVYDGSSLKVYVNGVEQGSKATSLAMVSQPVPVQMAAANCGGWGQEFFQGALSGVRMYNRALSSNEIGLVYQNDNSQPEHPGPQVEDIR